MNAVEYNKLLGDAFGDGTRKARLEAFMKAMDLRAMAAAYDITACREPVDFGTMRGQISICSELASGAKAALDADEESANSKDAEGIRR